LIREVAFAGRMQIAEADSATPASRNTFPQKTLILCSPLRLSTGWRITPMTAIRRDRCEPHASHVLNV
jgi:hypothetical protein